MKEELLHKAERIVKMEADTKKNDFEIEKAKNETKNCHLNILKFDFKTANKNLPEDKIVQLIETISSKQFEALESKFFEMNADIKDFFDNQSNNQNIISKMERDLNEKKNEIERMSFEISFMLKEKGLLENELIKREAEKAESIQKNQGIIENRDIEIKNLRKYLFRNLKMIEAQSLNLSEKDESNKNLARSLSLLLSEDIEFRTRVDKLSSILHNLGQEISLNGEIIRKQDAHINEHMKTTRELSQDILEGINRIKHIESTRKRDGVEILKQESLKMVENLRQEIIELINIIKKSRLETFDNKLLISEKLKSPDNENLWM
jgi:hypothetical protein